MGLRETGYHIFWPQFLVKKSYKAQILCIFADFYTTSGFTILMEMDRTQEKQWILGTFRFDPQVSISYSNSIF